MHHFGLDDRRLWKAVMWAHVFKKASGPAIGRVVVWRHHVGVIVGESAGRWVVLSGNDGKAVRRRVRSVSAAIAFVEPNMKTASAAR